MGAEGEGSLGGVEGRDVHLNDPGLLNFSLSPGSVLVPVCHPFPSLPLSVSL